MTITGRHAGALVGVLIAGLLAAACSTSTPESGATSPTSPVVTTPTSVDEPVAPNEVREKLPLEFREMKLTAPANSQIKAEGAAGTGLRSCASLVTPVRERNAKNPSELLLDRRRANCYFLGPALVTGAGVESASVEYDDQLSQWVVKLHFKNDDYLTKVARPLAGKQVAVVLAGFVQSAPTVKPGFTGRDVQFAGGFTRAGAIEVAAVIMGIAASNVRVAAQSG